MASLFLLRLPILTLALIIDMLIGDPPRLWSRYPHPVVLMGRFIGYIDRALNKQNLSQTDGRSRSLLALVLLSTAAILIGGYMALLSYFVPLFLSVELFIVFSLLASGSLLSHLNKVLIPLSADNITDARQAVAKIVGRDTQAMTTSDVTRAAIESAAESSSDGVLAPALAYLFFGLPGLCLYKMVNTADSMIGHKDDQYRDFGRASALFDDVLNYIPARFNALLFAFAASLRGWPGLRGIKIASRDAKLHESPNAGWPEAAMAGILGIRLGGLRHYEGEQHPMPVLYHEGRDWLIWQDLVRAIYLCRLSYILFIVILIIISLILWFEYIIVK